PLVSSCVSLSSAGFGPLRAPRPANSRRACGGRPEVLRGDPGRPEIDAEHLLSHEEDVSGRELVLSAEANERTVRAPHVRQVHATVGARGHPAVETRHIAILGEQHVSALTAEVEPPLGDRERVPRGVSPDHQGEATDEALRRAAEALDAVGAGGETLQLLEADDLLTDAEDGSRLQRPGLV